MGASSPTCKPYKANMQGPRASYIFPNQWK
ncbi:uncharacterized protein G2W53_002914 [Senna tora]|uniref:Uncharacterized protein n=1 Tax=Senna tora TaxID=362788 RepID=A0A835CGE3_9FABA|nr:uncharacterized protein G2W53_002914 [Senna tora]